MEISLKAFDELNTGELFAIYKLRAEVFIVEQNCPYQDVDDKDLKALHLMFREGTRLLAYCRIIPPKIAYPNAAIGRVVVSGSARKRGLGKGLMKEAVKAATNLFGTSISLSGQTYLKKFYNDLGFIETGKEYLEDDIPHMEMEYKYVKTEGR